MDKVNDLAAEFGKFPVAQRILPHAELLQLLAQLPRLIDNVDQCIRSDTLALSRTIINISGCLVIYDCLVPDNDSAVDIICRKRAFLHLVADDTACLEIHDDADNDIDKDNAENNHTDIQV